MFPPTRMGLQRHSHSCLVPVIHVHEMADRGVGGGPAALGGLLPLREDGVQA